MIWVHPYALSGLGFNAFAICMAGGRFVGDRIVQRIGRERTVTARRSSLGAIGGLFFAALAGSPNLIHPSSAFGLAGLGMSKYCPGCCFSLARPLRIPGAIDGAQTVFGLCDRLPWFF